MGVPSSLSSVEAFVRQDGVQCAVYQSLQDPGHLYDRQKASIVHQGRLMRYTGIGRRQVDAAIAQQMGSHTAAAIIARCTIPRSSIRQQSCTASKIACTGEGRSAEQYAGSLSNCTARTMSRKVRVLHDVLTIGPYLWYFRMIDSSRMMNQLQQLQILIGVICFIDNKIAKFCWESWRHQWWDHISG